MKRIYRSQSDRVLAGVCGGFAEYFKIDPVMVRLVWIFLTLVGGSGIIAYVLAVLFIPRRDDTGQMPIYRRIIEKSRDSNLWGIVLIILGSILLIQYSEVAGKLLQRFWGFGFNLLLAIILVGSGVYLLSTRRSNSNRTFGLNWKAPFHLSATDRVLAGVCGGIAESLAVDSTIIRLLSAFGTVMTMGAGIIVYVILALVLPRVDAR